MKWGCKVIAFDIGGTSTRIAIVENYKIKKYVSVPTPKERNLFIKTIEDLIEDFLDSSVEGIGIGIASPIKNGKIMNAPNLALKNFDLKKHLEKKFKVKVGVKNDAGCVALAESKIGFKKNNFLIITLGTGIGGGIVANGVEYRGEGFGAEFGHIFIRGVEWESLWKGMRRKMKEEFGQETLVRDLVKMRDKKAKKLLTEAADFMGEGIASLISVLDPEAVLIAGGLKESGNKFLVQINKAVEKYNFLPKKTPVIWTKVNHPGIIGASLLVK